MIRIEKVIIAGSRTVSPSPDEIDDVLKSALMSRWSSGFAWDPAKWTHVVCGMAKGAGLAGKAWAERRGIEVLQRPITPRMVTQHGKYLAPKMRNREMAELADAAVLFWDGKSGGTADMCIRMAARDKPVLVVPWRPLARTPKSRA